MKKLSKKISEGALLHIFIENEKNKFFTSYRKQEILKINTGSVQDEKRTL